MNNYESYKETDIPWLGEIPSHWEINRVKQYGNIYTEKNFNNKEKNVLSLTYKGVIKNNIKNPNGLIPKSYETYQIFEKNDLVFKLIDLENIKTSRVGLVPERGIMSPAYIRLTLKNTIIQPEYAFYYFYKLYIKEVYNNLGKGVRSTIGNEDLKNFMIPVPPISEQIQIANYLDWKINEIDRLILIEKEQIKELENLKQKHIDEIYQNIKTKNFISLSKIGTFFKGGGFSRENLSDSDYGAILYGDIYTKYNYFFEECISKIDENAYFNSKCIDGNVVLFTGSGETKEDIGKSVAYVGTKKIALGGDIIALKPNKNFPPKFIAYFSNTSNIKAFKHMESTGDIIVHITLGAIKSIKIPFITIEEQKDIVKKIDEYILNLKNLIALIEDKIKYFLSLKQSLIAEVVTGKIDVRNITIPQYEKVETIFETDNIDETEVQDYGD